MRSIITMIKNAFKIARLLSCDDSADLRFASVSFLGKTQKVMLFTPYGLMSKPPADSLALVWSQQAQESNGIGMADDPRNRPLKNLASGEVALGNYLTGNHIYFDENGLCTIVAQDMTINISDDIQINAANLTMTLDDDCTISADTISLEATTSIDISAPTINIDGTTIAISGTSVGITGSLTNGGVNIGSTHIHSQGNDSNGDTEVDTGVPHS